MPAGPRAGRARRCADHLRPHTAQPLTSPGGGVPSLPSQAPLAEPTRLWLDGMLAGIFSRVAPSALAASPAVTLLWASQTGNAEALAERLAAHLNEAGVAVALSCMADYPPQQLASAGSVSG